MVISGNPEGRDPHDNYPTDPRWVQLLLRHVKLEPDVWEPACGDGAMVQVLEEAGYGVRATDVVSGDDFLVSRDRANTIITNPPYSQVDGFITHGLVAADKLLVLLLGWHTVAGGVQRGRRIWNAHPPNTILCVTERMRVGEKVSQFNHAWCIWEMENRTDRATLVWASINDD